MDDDRVIDVSTRDPTPARSGRGPHAHLEDVEGVVFNVQHFSVHDGPGIAGPLHLVQ